MQSNDDDDDDEGINHLDPIDEVEVDNMAAVEENNSDMPTTFSQYANRFKSKLSLLEVSGMCGDFGTLFPLLVALARERRIHLAPTLFLTGLVHLVTGTYWDLPMPLQPMHTISAQAISQALDITQVTTAGIGMGVSFLILQWGGIEFLHKCIPKSVIGGLQLGVGWKLAVKGMEMIRALPWLGSLDCIVGAIMVSALTLYGLRPQSRSTSSSGSSIFERLVQQPPMGLFMFAVGLIIALVQLLIHPSSMELQPEPLLVNALKGVTLNDWTKGLLDGTLPQLPLTTLNSCLSVCLLAQTLFPDQGHRVSRKSVCRSVGLMNAVLCPLGLMPHCHGAGGLAGQHRLGATSGVSMVVLGLFKIGLSFVASHGSLIALLDALPVSILGVLLVLSGHELAVTGIKAVLGVSASASLMTTTRTSSDSLNQDITIALITGVVIVGTGEAHVGTLCGWLAYMVYGTGFRDLCGCGNDNRNRISAHLSDDDDEERTNERGAYCQVGTNSPAAYNDERCQHA